MGISVHIQLIHFFIQQKLTHTIVKQLYSNKDLKRKKKDVEKLCYWWECKVVHPLWKTFWPFLKKPTTELPYDPTIALVQINRSRK